MVARGSSEAGRALVLVVLIAAFVIIVGGGGVAGACKFTSLDCHLRANPPTRLSRTSGEVSLPQGFSAETVVAGLDAPTSFDFLPDGRILIGEKSGLVKLVEDGSVVSTPVLDLREAVEGSSFRGLVALAVDPDFDENHFIYVIYSAQHDGISRTDASQPTHTLVSRFVVSGNTGGNERAILGGDGQATGTCRNLPPTADCLRLEHVHLGGDIVFAGDGSMFVSTGDGGGRPRVEDVAFDAQDVNALGGKILRVTRDGQGVASNPFFDGDGGSNRSKVWALGLRNPFRVALSPNADFLVVGEVGDDAADEVDVVRASNNFGWPCYEAGKRNRLYKATRRCAAVYRRADELRPPTIPVPIAGVGSVTGGVFYTGVAYPEEYRSYFYADWAKGWIRHAPIDPQTGELLGKPSEFAANAGGPVAFRMGPDGDLYVLGLNYGELYRVTYSG